MHDRGMIDRSSRVVRLSPTKPKLLDAYIVHLREVESWWNSAFAKCDLPFTFDASEQITLCELAPDTIRAEQGIRDFLMWDDRDGIAWENQILTAARILARIINHPGQSGICIGPTQGGKTGIIHNCQWIAPAIHLLTGTKLQCLSLLPNKKGIEEQSQDESRKYNALYKLCKIKLGDAHWSLATYWHDVLEVYDPNLGYDPECATHIKRRCKGSVLEEIRTFCDKARESNSVIMFEMDEIQWGADAEGLQTQIMSISSQLVEIGAGDFLVGFSATPWQVIGLKKFWQVRTKLTKDYCGFNFFNGEPIDEEVECAIPNYMSIRDSSKMIGNLEFKNIHRAAYCHKEKFDKLRRCQEIGRPKDDREFPVCHGIYRKRVEQSIAAGLNWALIHENPCDGKGAVIRLPMRNDMVPTFSKGLVDAGLDPSIEIIVYTGAAVGQKIRRIIQNRDGAKENRPYLIIPTGAARMADNFPIEVKYYFDFSDDSSLIALFQGLLGRSCGFGKGSPPPIVILGAKPKQVVDEFVRTKGMPVIMPTHQVTDVGTDVVVKSGRTQSITLRRRHMAKDPELRSVWEKIQGIVNTIPSDAVRPRPSRLKEGHWISDFWKNFFSEEVLAKIESTPNIGDEQFLEPFKILRPGELDAKGKGWAKKPHGRIHNGKLGFRNAKSRGSDNSNLPTDRFETGGSKRDPSNRFRLEVQVHVDEPLRRGASGMAGRWQLVAVRLRLVDQVRYGGSNGRTVLPNAGCAYHNFLTDDEKELVDAKYNQRTDR